MTNEQKQIAQLVSAVDALRKRVAELEGAEHKQYDDSKLSKRVAALESVEQYNDSDLAARIAKLEKVEHKQYDDSVLTARIAKLESVNIAELIKRIVTKDLITKLYRG